MIDNLVIVESASKSKTIQKILSNSNVLSSKGTFKVIASSGHVIDLPKKEIGVDTNTWNLKYEQMKDKTKLIQEMKKLAKESNTVYLAADPDREGEAIAWHINNLLKIPNSKRITFNEITKGAIEEALLNPRELDIPLIDAQESRRALDRIVGYKVSPLLWNNFPSAKGLSAGRVQSAALAEIIQRYIEYTTFDKEFYWNIESQFTVNKKKIETSLYYKNDKNIYNFTDKDKALFMLEELKYPGEWNFTFNRTITHTHPSAPYTTSSLQQEAYEKYHMSAKQTMMYAQKLYEKGYVTYIRTDSVNISDDAKKMIHNYLRNRYDNSYVYNRSFKNKVANAQEAHECIRPSKIDVLSEQLEDEDLTPGHIKLYDLIWRKSVSSQMLPAEYIQYAITITNSKDTYKDFEFRGKISLLNKVGFLEIWQPNQEVKHDDIKQWDELLDKSNLSIKFKKACANGNITRPKSLYNEPRLIKWMETEGIGRPSTYSTVVNKLFDKGYITKGKPPVIQVEIENYVLDKQEIKCNKKEIKVGNTDKDCHIPTEIGMKINEYLKKTIPNIIDKTFTAEMEEELDKVSRNEMTKQQLLSTFYKPFEYSINNATIEKNTDVSNKSRQIIQEFGETQLINTKYGPSLFIPSIKKYISIAPYIEWQKKTIDEVNEEDVIFLTSLPKKYNDINVEYGRYGLYLSYKSKNYRLPKKEWDKILSDTIEYQNLKNFIK